MGVKDPETEQRELGKHSSPGYVTTDCMDCAPEVPRRGHVIMADDDLCWEKRALREHPLPQPLGFFKQGQQAISPAVKESPNTMTTKNEFITLKINK